MAMSQAQSMHLPRACHSCMTMDRLHDCNSGCPFSLCEQSLMTALFEYELLMSLSLRQGKYTPTDLTFRHSKNASSKSLSVFDVGVGPRCYRAGRQCSSWQ